MRDFLISLLWFFTAKSVFCVVFPAAFQDRLINKEIEYEVTVEKWLKDVDKDLAEFNRIAAHLTWQLSTEPDDKTAEQARKVATVRNDWRNRVCNVQLNKKSITDEQNRKIFLLCRGPRFSDEKLLHFLDVGSQLSEAYNSPICLTGNAPNGSVDNFPTGGQCFYGEPDLDRLMKRTDLSSDQLKWIWLNWHDAIGPKIKPLFMHSVNLQNEAARANGYDDMGEIWREELEIDNLESLVLELYKEMEPLYVLLHAVMRHKLYQKFGPKEIDPRGPIPIHLLGNTWGQDWSSYIDLFAISDKRIELQRRLQKKTQDVRELVLSAEDFYTSMHLPKMTRKFWKYSIFEEDQNTTLCHGTAANLYSEGDFRMLMCGSITMDDFYVIHHEMGHIEYYMAYEEQPAIFQDGTNSAFHESIGDAIMHGVMTPQHLHRLNLISDQQLLDPDTELSLLFLQALAKVPEIPYALIVDKFRWEVFRGNVAEEDWNEYYWNLNKRFRGIRAPEERSEAYFDAGTKFHIPDNTPYTRYFLSGIIQMQLFKSLCQCALYGDSYQGVGYVPLQRCDIYGSKQAGKKLLEMMENGASIHWSQAMQIITGTKNISTKPLMEYYQPVYDWLQDYVSKHNVYVGW